MSSKIHTKQIKGQLIADLSDLIGRYTVLTEAQELICAHYVMHTYQFSPRCQGPLTTPYLYVHSAQKGSGKTTFGIEIMGTLCRNFEAVTNLTTATLFRLTETGCTLGIDEVDTLFDGTKGNNDMVGVANSGYRKGGYVPRYDPRLAAKDPEGDGMRRFNTFCPKVFVGIDNGKMKDTTRDRCIPIHMHRATASELASKQKFYSYRIVDELESLSNRLADWAIDNTAGMRDYDPPEDTELSQNPRTWEICVPLLQVAHVTGYEQELLEALREVFAEQCAPENTLEIDVLVTLAEMFEDTGKIKSSDVLARLTNDPRFRGWNGKKLGAVLAPFGIRIKPVRFSADDVQRGITVDSCADAFERYLRPMGLMD